MTRERIQRLGDHSVRLALLAMLIVVPLVFCTWTHDVFELNKLTAFRLFTLLAFLAYLTRTLLVQAIPIRPSALWRPILLVGLSSLLSTLVTNNLATSVFGVYEDFEGILTIANYLLLWFLVHQTVRSGQDTRKFLTAVVLAGVLATGYGLAQNFGIDFVLWNPNTYSANRFFGSLGNPNFLAAYALMTLPVTFIFFLTARRIRSKGLLAGALLVMTITIFFTKSRGAFYALLAEVVFFTAYIISDHLRGGDLWRVNRRWFAVLAVLAGLTFFSPTVRQTITATAARTAATLNVKAIKITPRLYIWRSALQMMRDHPVLGVGLDAFQISFPKYRLAEYWQLEWNGTPEKAHNFFLQIGATTGLLGLGAWLWLLIVYFGLLRRQLKTLDGSRRHWTAAIGIAQIGFLVQNQFNFTVIAYGSLFWFFLALGPAVGREEPDATVADPDQPVALATLPLWRWMGFLGAAALIALALVFTLRLWVGDVFFKRGIIWLARGNFSAALEELKRPVALSPFREIYWVKYGIAHEEAAKAAQDKEPLLRRAVEIHEHTIRLNPLNGYDYNNLGRTYKYWGDYVDPRRLTDAEAACRKAAELDPYNVYFALDLASIHLSQRRWNDAAAIARRLVETFPDFAIPYAYLGYVDLTQGRSDQALQRLEEATSKNWRGDINTRASTWSNLGIIRARRAEPEGALAAFREALTINPRYLEARLNLAYVLEQIGRTPEAVAEYRMILSQAPNYPRAAELQRKIEQLEGGGKP